MDPFDCLSPETKTYVQECLYGEKLDASGSKTASIQPSPLLWVDMDTGSPSPNYVNPSDQPCRSLSPQQQGAELHVSGNLTAYSNYLLILKIKSFTGTLLLFCFT
jgi:hypothetical protein